MREVSSRQSVVCSESAPRPIGPYSQAIESGGFLFLSGQIGIDPQTGVVTSDDVAVQTELALRNLSSVLEAAGADLGDVVKVCIYLRDIKDFPAVNEAYSRFFTSWKPARTTVGGVQLPKDALVEIDAIARAR